MLYLQAVHDLKRVRSSIRLSGPTLFHDYSQVVKAALWNRWSQMLLDDLIDELQEVCVVLIQLHLAGNLPCNNPEAVAIGFCGDGLSKQDLRRTPRGLPELVVHVLVRSKDNPGKSTGQLIQKCF